VRVAALLLLLGGVAGALSGCGRSSPHAAELEVERTDLTVVSRYLHAAQIPIQREVAASRAVWPLIVDGIPASIPQSTPLLLGAASARSTQIPAPPFTPEMSRLTGPASGIAGLLDDFSRLTERGWTMLQATVAEIEHGSPATARFASANAALYIHSVYDGHFDLGLVGKSLLAAYRQLGGSAAFGDALTQAEVDALARAYSPGAVDLKPHAGRNLET